MEPDLQEPPVMDAEIIGNPETATSGSGSDTFVIFMMGGQRFAVSVSRVRAILDLQPVYRLPNAPHGCDGVIDVRGESIPLIDLAGGLGIHGQAGEAEDDSRIIVFETIAAANRPAIANGVVADKVLNVATIYQSNIEAPPKGATGLHATGTVVGLARMDGELVAILNIDAALGM